MSVLINSISPPLSCKSCRLKAWNNDAGFYCGFLSDNPFKCVCPMDSSKRNDCPLVEIPPHGRLVDADNLKDNINIYFFPVIGAAIDNAPTIIEKEK